MLLCLDGFDYTTTLYKWPYIYGASISGSGRFGGNRLHIIVNSGRYAGRDIAAAATLIAGFAWWYSSLGYTLFSFHDGGSSQCYLIAAADGALVLYNGTGTEIDRSDAGCLTTGAWFYIEIKVTIGNSAAYEVRVNGITVFAGTGDTQNTANSYANRVYFYGANEFDDFYVCDNTGTVNNDFLGDCRVVAQYPLENGAYAAWTPSVGDAHACVDETPGNDTDYISSATAAQKSTFTFPALGITGDVYGVQAHLFAAKDDAGSRLIRRVCRVEGADYTDDAQSVGNTYLYYSVLEEIKPGSSDLWNVADVDAAEEGVELVS